MIDDELGQMLGASEALEQRYRESKRQLRRELLKLIAWIVFVIVVAGLLVFAASAAWLAL